MTDPTARDCCGGGEGTCETHTDTFGDGHLNDFEEEIGSWEDEAGTNPLATPDQEAAIIYRGSYTTPGNLWQVKASCNKDPSDAANNVVRWRIIFGWVDTNNFWYAEFEETTVSSIITSRGGKIVQVSSGSPTIHKEFTASGLGLPDLGGDDSALVVCYQNGVVKAFVEFQEYYTLTHEETVGGEFGLGSGTFTNIDFVQFHNFTLTIDTEGGGNCDDCPVNEFPCDDGCSDNPPPINFQAEISGITNNDVSNVDCSGCANANGTRVLISTGTCSWVSTNFKISPPHPLFGHSYCNDDYRVSLTIQDVGSGNYKIRVEIENTTTSAPAGRFELTQAGKFACNDINGLDIPFVLAGVCGPDNPPISNPTPVCTLTAL